MSRPATRLLAVLEWLQAHGRLTGAELARRLEVNPRTVRRYVARLEDMGVPVAAERGRDGAYRLVSGFKLPPMMFTDDESVVLALGLRAARELGVPGGGVAVATAQAKLERVMPLALKRRLRAFDQVKLEPPKATSSLVENRALVTLSAAAETRQRVRLRYQAADGASTARVFDPYGLAHRQGRWYVVGHCHLRRSERSFRLDRVVEVQPVEGQGAFERPVDFDALASVSSSVATLPRAFATEVLLRTDLVGARRALFSAAGALEPVAGGVLLRSQVDDLGWFALELSRLPFAFDIRTPRALRAALAANARRLLGLARGPRRRSR